MLIVLVANNHRKLLGPARRLVLVAADALAAGPHAAVVDAVVLAEAARHAEVGRVAAAAQGRQVDLVDPAEVVEEVVQLLLVVDRGIFGGASRDGKILPSSHLMFCTCFGALLRHSMMVGMPAATATPMRVATATMA